MAGSPARTMRRRRVSSSARRKLEAARWRSRVSRVEEVVVGVEVVEVEREEVENDVVEVEVERVCLRVVVEEEVVVVEGREREVEESREWRRWRRREEDVEEVWW